MKSQAHVVLQDKILKKLTMTKEEDCQVLNLLDAGEQICQFKEHLTRIKIMTEIGQGGYPSFTVKKLECLKQAYAFEFISME
jgi:hypothetical protein